MANEAQKQKRVYKKRKLNMSNTAVIRPQLSANNSIKYVLID